MGMVVGISRVRLTLFACFSLKDKRSQVKRLLARVRQEQPVAAAEVGELDKWQLCELGFVCVSNDAQVCERILDGALALLESKSEAEVIDESREIQHIS